MGIGAVFGEVMGNHYNRKYEEGDVLVDIRVKLVKRDPLTNNISEKTVRVGDDLLAVREKIPKENVQSMFNCLKLVLRTKRSE